MLAQVVSEAVMLPLYFISHVRTIPVTDMTLPTHALARARALLPAIIVGYILPSMAFFLAPPSIALDTRQIIAAAWQVFPVFLTILYTLFWSLHALIAPTNAFSLDAHMQERHLTYIWLRRSYLLSAAVSAVSHWMVVIHSLLSIQPSASFVHVFIPYVIYPYLPFTIPSVPLPAYRFPVRLTLQNDWFFSIVAAFLFLGWHHRMVARELSSPPNFKSWLARISVITILGGPGATFALEAIEREKILLSFPQELESSSVAKPSEKRLH